MRKLGVTPSTVSSIMPLFINVRDSEVGYTEVFRSRWNDKMMDTLIRTINRVIGGANLQPGEIAIVTPYQAQQSKILAALENSVSITDALSKVLLTTADRIHGSERAVVFFLAVFTADSGAGFLWDPNRLNIISTLASDYFIVIGDMAVADKQVFSRVADSSGGYIDPTVLRQWIGYFKKDGTCGAAVGN